MLHHNAETFWLFSRGSDSTHCTASHEHLTWHEETSQAEPVPFEADGTIAELCEVKRFDVQRFDAPISSSVRGDA